MELVEEGVPGVVAHMLRRPLHTARLVAKRIMEIPSKGLPDLRRRAADDFDETYGVETAKFVQFVPTDSTNSLHGVHYAPAPESAVRWSIENCGLDIEGTTFVDVGSGKGRVLIIAATYPFERIVGVEYSPALVDICQDNLRKVGIEERCEVVLGDAADYAFPERNLLAFLYNPFDATILARVLRNLAMKKPETRLAQLGPGHDVIRAFPFAKLIISSGEGPALYEIKHNGKYTP
jgi:SAM-dependent methyltransferase